MLGAGSDGTVQLGPNPVPAAVGVGSQVLETYTHAWDLARATGRPFEPPADLTATTWAIAQAVVSDEIRGSDDSHPFGPRVEVAADAPLLDQLIAFTGRDPSWSPAGS